jgi:hypothetical protein
VTPADIERAGVTFTLRSGEENSPGDPFGSVVVTIAGEDVFVENRHVGLVRRWQARACASLVPALRERLREAGFPSEPLLPPPAAGATFRVLTVDDGGATASVMMPEHAADGFPAWKAAFDLFDAVVRQTSGGALAIGPATASPLVDDTRALPSGVS